MTALDALPLLAHAGDHDWWPVWPLLWTALIGLVVWLVARRSRRRHDPLDRAREILAERFARGAIGAEEYRTRLGDLERSAR